MPIQKPEAIFENEQLRLTTWIAAFHQTPVEAWRALEFKQCRTAWLLAATCP
jgi:hypothetical protein